MNLIIIQCHIINIWLTVIWGGGGGGNNLSASTDHLRPSKFMHPPLVMTCSCSIEVIA